MKKKWRWFDGEGWMKVSTEEDRKGTADCLPSNREEITLYGPHNEVLARPPKTIGFRIGVGDDTP